MIKPRRLKISPRSNILEEAGKCRIVCGAWSLATYRTRGTIKRKAKSLSTSEKYILRCFFRNNEFGIASILFFQMRGRETFFNPGKISSSRARFANDCAQCHDKSLNSRGALTPSTFKAVLRDSADAPGQFQSRQARQREVRQLSSCDAEPQHFRYSYADKSKLRHLP